jgi:hypothetical protein
MPDVKSGASSPLPREKALIRFLARLIAFRVAAHFSASAFLGVVYRIRWKGENTV